MKAPALMLTVEDVSDALKISRTQVFGLLKSGDLSSVKIGRSRRITMAALTAYIAGLEAGE